MTTVNVQQMPVSGWWAKLACSVWPGTSCRSAHCPGGCFINISRALQDILPKFVYCKNRTSCENFKLKLCTCAQSHALGTCTKFQLEILTINVISGIAYFRKIILESSRNVSETTPRLPDRGGFDVTLQPCTLLWLGLTHWRLGDVAIISKV